jgi:hypothetical protein
MERFGTSEESQRYTLGSPILRTGSGSETGSLPQGEQLAEESREGTSRPTLASSYQQRQSGRSAALFFCARCLFTSKQSENPDINDLHVVPVRVVCLC